MRSNMCSDGETAQVREGLTKGDSIVARTAGQIENGLAE